MKKPVIITLCLALCLMVILGGSIAYLTDVDEDVNIMTLGSVTIELEEFERDDEGGLIEFHDGKTAYPLVGDLTSRDEFNLPVNVNFMDKIVRVHSTGKTPAYLRVFIGVPSALRNVYQTGEDALHLLLGKGIILPGTEDAAWTWAEDASASKYGVDIDGIPFDMLCFNYTKTLEPDEFTPPLLAGLYLDNRVTNFPDAEEIYAFPVNGELLPLDYDINIGLQIPICVQAIQAVGFTDAATSFEVSGMNDVDFDDLLDLRFDSGNGGGPEGNVIIDVYENLIQFIEEALFNWSENFSFTLHLAAESYDLSSEKDAQRLEDINAQAPSRSMTEIVVPSGSKVTLNLGKTKLPRGVNLIVEPSGELILIGE